MLWSIIVAPGSPRAAATTWRVAELDHSKHQPKTIAWGKVQHQEDPHVDLVAALHAAAEHLEREFGLQARLPLG